MTVRALLLRLEAPMMAFAAPMVDHHGPTLTLPGQAQTTGLLANALGYRHGDAGRLETLQERLRMASAALRAGTEMQDYQTADLGQEFLVDTGWTTSGRREDRAGGSARTGTHIRYRSYRADALVLVALRLDPAEEPPTLDDLAAAVDRPARPLFIGRKPCLPSSPMLAGIVEADDLLAALRVGAGRLAAELGDDLDQAPWAAEWPENEGAPPSNQARQLRRVDRRDWTNQFHGGERRVWSGHIHPADTMP